MTNRPLISVIIPARNEEDEIAGCLGSISEQDYPHSQIEVLVIDGNSSDSTRAVAEKLLANSDFGRTQVITNHGATRPSNLNRGLAHSNGELIYRVDARTRIPCDYLSRCADILSSRPEVAVVGGAPIAQAEPNASIVARGIARALRNPYATGLSRYRRGGGSGSGDTVYPGAFRKTQLDSERGWDERFLTNQDFELNQRMRRHGLIWYEADLKIGHRPRDNYRDLQRHYRRFGRWKAAGWLETGLRISPRQIALLVVPGVVVATGTWSLRRKPFLTLALAGVAAMALEATVGEPAPPSERAAAALAIGVVTGSWYLGVGEQFVRYAAGHRLLTKKEQPK